MGEFERHTSVAILSARHKPIVTHFHAYMRVLMPTTCPMCMPSFVLHHSRMFVILFLFQAPSETVSVFANWWFYDGVHEKSTRKPIKSLIDFPTFLPHIQSDKPSFDYM